MLNSDCLKFIAQEGGYQILAIVALLELVVFIRVYISLR